MKSRGRCGRGVGRHWPAETVLTQDERARRVHGTRARGWARAPEGQAVHPQHERRHRFVSGGWGRHPVGRLESPRLDSEPHTACFCCRHTHRVPGRTCHLVLVPVHPAPCGPRSLSTHRRDPWLTMCHTTQGRDRPATFGASSIRGADPGGPPSSGTLVEVKVSSLSWWLRDAKRPKLLFQEDPTRGAAESMLQNY